jgi:hypothetical protein
LVVLKQRIVMSTKVRPATPTEAIQDIETILNGFHEEARVTMCKYLLEICEQTVELL